MFKKLVCSLSLIAVSVSLGGILFSVLDEPPPAFTKTEKPQKTVFQKEPADPVKKPLEVAVQDPDAWLHDKKWSKSYDREGDRSLRVEHDSTRPSFRKKWLEWQGGEYIPVAKLEELAKIVLKRMPHVEETKASVALLVETAIAESMAGFYTNPSGGDLGVFQIREEVARELLTWLSASHKDILEAVNLFRGKERSLREELMRNVPFGMAVAIVEYWRKAGPDYERHAGSLRGRAEMWKSVYNSRLGEGTVAAYEKRTADYMKFDADNGPERLNARSNQAAKTPAVASKQPIDGSKKDKKRL